LTVEEVYTNAFDARIVDWIETGASPYLNDSDANYISVSLDAKEEGDWTFQNSAGSGTITSVKLRFEALLSIADCGSLAVYVWNGTAWILATEFTPTAPSYAWYEIEVKTILDTWAKINGAEVSVIYGKDLTGTCRVRRLTRKVDYTEAVTVVEVYGDGLTLWS
jgi:hypothetical protein